MTGFLSVYTPTYRRPFLLGLCRASVDGQTEPVDHVIVTDEVGIGIEGMFADIRNHTHLVDGEYVMVLSDDNILVDGNFAAELEAEIAANNDPDVVVFQGFCGSTLQPASWGGEPRITMIDLSCFAVRREIWQRHADCWGERYEGDFDFIHALWEHGYRFHWWPRVGFRTMQISRGAAE